MLPSPLLRLSSPWVAARCAFQLSLVELHAPSLFFFLFPLALQSWLVFREESFPFIPRLSPQKQQDRLHRRLQAETSHSDAVMLNAPADELLAHPPLSPARPVTSLFPSSTHFLSQEENHSYISCETPSLPVLSLEVKLLGFLPLRISENTKDASVVVLFPNLCVSLRLACWVFLVSAYWKGRSLDLGDLDMHKMLCLLKENTPSTGRGGNLPALKMANFRSVEQT